MIFLHLCISQHCKMKTFFLPKFNTLHLQHRPIQTSNLCKYCSLKMYHVALLILLFCSQSKFFMYTSLYYVICCCIHLGELLNEFLYNLACIFLLSTSELYFRIYICIVRFLYFYTLSTQGNSCISMQILCYRRKVD